MIKRINMHDKAAALGAQQWDSLTTGAYKHMTNLLPSLKPHQHQKQIFNRLFIVKSFWLNYTNRLYEVGVLIEEKRSDWEKTTQKQWKWAFFNKNKGEN